MRIAQHISFGIHFCGLVSHTLKLNSISAEHIQHFHRNYKRCERNLAKQFKINYVSRVRKLHARLRAAGARRTQNFGWTISAHRPLSKYGQSKNTDIRVPKHHVMQVYGGVEAKLHPIKPPPLQGGDWSGSHSDRFNHAPGHQGLQRCFGNRDNCPSENKNPPVVATQQISSSNQVSYNQQSKKMKSEIDDSGTILIKLLRFGCHKNTDF
jgi:hypothetical protein